MHVHNIVLLLQRDCLIYNLKKELQIERNIVYHLGVLKRRFDNKLFDENLMENMDNGTTIGFWNDTLVKYAKVVSDKDSITMVVRISEDCRLMIKAPMLIFTNPNSSYSIRTLDNNIPRVSYQIGPKGWMDQALFADFFEESRAFQSNLHDFTKIIWIDNCLSHNLTLRLEAVLQEKHSILRYLPPCSTHLCQPADTFIVSKIKDAWTKRWEEKKTNLIANNA